MLIQLLMFIICWPSVWNSDVLLHCGPLDKEEQESIFIQLTNSSIYKKWIRPQIDGQVLVNISMEMYSLASINERDSEFTLNLLLDLEWIDSRLSLNVSEDCECIEDLRLEGSEYHLDRIWSPNLRVPSNKNPSAMDRDAQIILLRVSTNGYVKLRKRLVLSIFCQMDFKYYPFDTQICPVIFKSSDLSEEHLALKWTTEEPFVSDNNFYMNGFEVEITDLKSGSTKSRGEVFSSVEVIFNFKRLWTRYILDIYLPTCLVIIVSWMSFWMDITATPARITLGVTTMLTFVTVAKESREDLPDLSYANALDMWFVVCTVFIFLSLVEFSIITYISRAEKRKIKEIKTLRRTISQSQLSLSSSETHHTFTSNDGLFLCPPKKPNITRFPFESIESKVPNSPILSDRLFSIRPNHKKIIISITPPESPNPDIGQSTPATPESNGVSLKPTPVEIAESIDRKCRIIFPLIFIIFNMCYWTTVHLFR